MKTIGIASKNSAECEAAHTQLSTFIQANCSLNSSPHLYRGSTIRPVLGLVHVRPDRRLLVRVHSPELAGSHVATSPLRKKTRTDGRLIRSRRRGPTICCQRRLLAACCHRGQAAGGSAAGPEPPSLDRCCKLDELEPTRENERETRHLLYYDILINKPLFAPYLYFLPKRGQVFLYLIWFG